jgi:glycosyltransferase involved in cell wall biosynthesis
MVKVSVLIPTYNLACHLDETIQSVLKQTYKNFELIIIDDNSPDETDSVVKKYLSDKRIKYIKNRKNLGLQGNWNKCLLEASGEYIKFLNHDDTFHPDLLKEYVSIMDTHPDVSLVIAYTEHMHEPNKIVAKPIDYGLIKGQVAIRESLLRWNWIGEPTSVMFRRSNLHIGLFDTTYFWVLDWEMWLRQLTVGDLYVIPKILNAKRFHADSASSSIYKNFKHCFEEYYFAVNIYNFKLYSLSENDAKQILKQRIEWIIKCIPGMIKARNLKAIKQAVSILRHEGSLLYAFYKTILYSGKYLLSKSLK